VSTNSRPVRHLEALRARYAIGEAIRAATRQNRRLGTAKERELHDMLLRFPCADDTFVCTGETPGIWLPLFRIFLDLVVGNVDEQTRTSQGFPLQSSNCRIRIAIFNVTDSH